MTDLIYDNLRIPDSYPYLKCTKDQFMTQFPAKELYRLFVDGIKQKDGWKKFENREPGYLKAMLNSFFTELAFLEEDLSSEIVNRIQNNAIHEVDLTNNSPTFREKGNATKFGLFLGRNLSSKGYDEIIELESQNVVELKVLNNGRNGTNSFNLYAFSGDVNTKVNEIIRNYNEQIKSANTDEDKIKIIVKMVSILERVHPFHDANCRTICMVVLYRELIKYGFMPPILDDPNQFDGYSADEMCRKIAIGMARSDCLMKGKPIMPSFIVELLANIKFPKNFMPVDDFIARLDDLTLPKNFVSREEFISDEQIAETSEDERLYQIILHEALDKHSDIKLDGLSIDYEEMLNQLAKEFAANNDAAKNIISEAIKFGCINQVKKIFEKLNKNPVLIDAVVENCKKLRSIYLDRRNEYDPKLADSLLQWVKLDSVDENGNNALHYVLQDVLYMRYMPPAQNEETKKLREMELLKHTERIKNILKEGANPLLKNQNGEIPFFLAVQSGHLEIVKLFLSNETVLESIRNDKNSEVLFIAIEKNLVKLVKDLLELGINPNAIDTSGLTPLSSMTSSQDIEIVELLLQRSDKETVNRAYRGATPLMMWAKRSASVVEAMLKNEKVDPKIRDSRGWTALHYAVNWKKKDVVSIFLTLLKPEDLKEIFNAKPTPLELAMNKECWPIVEQLLKHLKPTSEQLKSLNLSLLATKITDQEVKEMIKPFLIADTQAPPSPIIFSKPKDNTSITSTNPNFTNLDEIKPKIR